MEKILIWNINQRAGYGKSDYPKLVLDSFDKELDIIIFTEFYKHSDWKNTFSNDKYLFEASNNGDNHNEILIAYNREKYSKIIIISFVIFVTLEKCYDKFIKNIHKGGALWF